MFMFDPPKINRFDFAGDGRVIVARNDQLAAVIVKIGNHWIFARHITSGSLFSEDSLIELFKKSFASITTNDLKNFLTVFGLSFQDVFNDSPEKTTNFIEQMCAELKVLTKTPGQHTLQNLREFADSLTLETSREPKAILEETIATLKKATQPQTQETLAT
jgi:hypothetical protein